MKKYIFAALFALALACPSAVKADDASYSLLVNTADGLTVEYDFEYLPIATFEGDVMIITDDRNVNGTRFEMDNVVNMTFKAATSGVEALPDTDHIKVSVANGQLSVRGLEADSGLVVFDVAGKVVASAFADPDGCASVNIEALGKGVYVASMPGYSFKFIR